MRRTCAWLTAAIAASTFSFVGTAQTEVNVDCFKLFAPLPGDPQVIYLAPGLELPEVLHILCPGALAPPGLPYTNAPLGFSIVRPSEIRANITAGTPVNLMMANRTFTLLLAPNTLTDNATLVYDVDDNGTPTVTPLNATSTNTTITTDGYDVNHPFVTAAITVTDAWVAGAVFAEEGTYFIEPVDDSGATYLHVSYLKSIHDPILQDLQDAEQLCHLPAPNTCSTVYPVGKWPTSPRPTRLVAKITCIYVDAKYLDHFGKRTWTNQVRRTMNIVQQAYVRDVGIQVYLPCLNYTDHTAGASNCETGLSNFKSNRPRNWDAGDRLLTQLRGKGFTNKFPNGRVCAGYAGVTTYDTQFSVPYRQHHAVVSQQGKGWDEAMRALVLAHELGHNSGAWHDSTETCRWEGPFTCHISLMHDGFPCPSSRYCYVDGFYNPARTSIRARAADSWQWPHP